MKWRVFPLVEKPGQTLSIFIISILIFISVYYISDSGFWSGLSLFLFFLSLHSFFFPTDYLINENGVEITHCLKTTVKKWEQIRTVSPCRHGVFLSPFVKPSRLENFRGIYLMSGKENLEQIIDFVEKKLSSFH